MRYVSTRGQAPTLGFLDATLAGLARDGGLYTPATIPAVAPGGIAALAGLSYATAAARLVAPFVGEDLGAALTRALDDFDGFYTFVVGTRSGFGVLRDPIACKPAIMAETDRYVAFGSEYRAIVGLPGIYGARVWEPEPATVYFWDRAKAA